MKKEYLAAIILGLFLLAYIFDTIAGPVSFVLKSPFEFLQGDLLSRYPFTTVSIVIKTIALFSSILLVFSMFEKKQLTKGLVMFFIAAMFELYSIQQLATGSNLIPVVWTMTLTATGLLLIIPSLIYIVLGLVFLVIDKTIKPVSDNDIE
ncbi:MAG: hypothetical protein US40_C0004G0087 [Candidatus Roizmanbacteria bacterium GW2011_GWC2_37_13]|uniref:Uncharacterized protein n=1 Tax=Candidatus Roizmanbacteria bacterium GW2011_GWC2_37_13 TaxID=1618486 RepID=A0A0G0G7M3_9BACT|nr:MAG: hypothetical protein US38_C0001G0074 [Candidatus Roizmanbacteria bacterium GW2011_GWC1_37_12]KKQ26052.1 MAG: hypothetical protein US40_C0004G0087 [Candidatus Roizmanbacteria bacterium GW2011_GWC2_37_13]